MTHKQKALYYRCIFHIPFKKNRKVREFFLYFLKLCRNHVNISVKLKIIVNSKGGQKTPHFILFCFCFFFHFCLMFQRVKYILKPEKDIQTFNFEDKKPFKPAIHK